MLLPDSFLWMIILGLFGVIGIILCAKVGVNHLIGLVKYFGIAEGFIGLTILSIGISLPEIGTDLAASLGIFIGEFDYQLTSSLALGANIGSSITQQTLIIGLVVLLVGEIKFTQKFLQESYTAVMLVTLFTLALAWDGLFSRVDGILLLVAFIGYVFFMHKRQQRGHLHHIPTQKDIVLKYSVPIELTMVTISFVGLLLCSSYVLLVGEQLVYTTGYNGSLIAVLTLGLVTALPELFVTLHCYKKNATGLALGALIGSNIVNLLLAVGIGASISEFYVPLPFIHWDLPIQLITAALLLWWIMFNNKRLGTKGGLFLICLYFVYLSIRILIFQVD